MAHDAYVPVAVYNSHLPPSYADSQQQYAEPSSPPMTEHSRARSSPPPYHQRHHYTHPSAPPRENADHEQGYPTGGDGKTPLPHHEQLRKRHDYNMGYETVTKSNRLITTKNPVMKKKKSTWCFKKVGKFKYEIGPCWKKVRKAWIVVLLPMLLAGALVGDHILSDD